MVQPELGSNSYFITFWMWISGKEFNLFKPLFAICKVKTPVLPTSGDVEYFMRKACYKLGPTFNLMKDPQDNQKGFPVLMSLHLQDQVCAAHHSVGAITRCGTG